MNKKINILLAEDEPNFGAVLKSYLTLAGFNIEWCKNGKEAFSSFHTKEFDLFILDVMMPEMDGFTLANAIRKKLAFTPIIFLTARSQKEDVLKGYKNGANDFLTKPFDSDILVEKIKVLCKQQTNSPAKEIEKEYNIGNFSFYPNTRLLTNKDFKKTLSPKESQLLTELCLHKSTFLQRSYALNKIWNQDDYFTTRSMDVYIAKLRKYLKSDETISIKNIHGNGYQLICG